MKILILSKKFPYPLREGEPIAITYLSRSLVERGCSVSILVMNTTKHYFNPENLPSDYNHFNKIFSVKVDNRISIHGAVRSLISGKSYILDRFVSEEYEEKLIEVLSSEDYDVVQIETPYLSHCIPIVKKYSTAKIAMRAHNVEHNIWSKVAEMSKNPLKKWYLRNQNKALRKYEIVQLNQYDVMVAITANDLQAFQNMGFKGIGVSAPVGIDVKEYKMDEVIIEEISIAFIGALDWMPNQDGLIWFIENVWPVLENKYPRLKFHIAGKNTPDWLRKYTSESVVFHGEVEDAKDFIHQHPLLIAPLFSGSGIKIKVLEGMALKRAVITTSIGVEGIPALHGTEIFIGDDVEQFIEHISTCVENVPLVSAVGQAAQNFIKREFDNLEIADKVIDAYQKAITQR